MCKILNHPKNRQFSCKTIILMLDSFREIHPFSAEHDIQTRYNVQTLMYCITQVICWRHIIYSAICAIVLEMASWVTRLNPEIQVELKDVFLCMECQNSHTNHHGRCLKGRPEDKHAAFGVQRITREAPRQLGRKWHAWRPPSGPIRAGDLFWSIKCSS